MWTERVLFSSALPLPPFFRRKMLAAYERLLSYTSAVTRNESTDAINSVLDTISGATGSIVAQVGGRREGGRGKKGAGSRDGRKGDATADLSRHRTQTPTRYLPQSRAFSLSHCFLNVYLVPQTYAKTLASTEGNERLHFTTMIRQAKAYLAQGDLKVRRRGWNWSVSRGRGGRRGGRFFLSKA